MRRIALLIVAAALSGCGTPTPSAAPELTIFAAASLRDAFEELATAYNDELGVAVTLSFDASSALRTQIEEGAPADVFASADVQNAQSLVDSGLTDGGTETFATNALTVVAPADAEGGVETWRDLAGSGVRVVAAGDDVPITRYALELVANLAAHPTAPAGFADAYAANVVSREDNVRAALAKIEVGEGDAAIVYETDARSSGDVVVIPIPEEATVLASYAAVALAEGSPEARGFVEWLRGDMAQSILADHGFRPPP